VQFHPESIASEHGLRIFENFLDLAAQWNHNERRTRISGSDMLRV
jgi:anthranilate synthase component 2